MSAESQQAGSVRTTALTVIVLGGIAAYVVAGFGYAAGHSLQLAGMSGASYWMGLAGQVAGWPLMMFTHGS